MVKISDSEVHEVLLESGFVRYDSRKPLFFIDSLSDVHAAFYCRVVRNKSGLRLGGGIGPLFYEFEDLWSRSISNSERKLDATLPLIMLIDNFEELLEQDIFQYSDLAHVEVSCNKIINLITQLPRSTEEFDKCILSCQIISKPFSDYLHISAYNDNDNLYFRKSIAFIEWYTKKHPSSLKKILSCLTVQQTRRLKEVGLQGLW